MRPPVKSFINGLSPSTPDRVDRDELHIQLTTTCALGLGDVRERIQPFNVIPQ
jgi:hypothetical protein